MRFLEIPCSHWYSYSSHLLCLPTASVEDSRTTMLSEIHDKVLAAATQERQVAVATVILPHSQLDSQEKQRMIKAYGNLVEEEEEYLYMFLCMDLVKQ